mgnify:CR=1 FL=1
MLKFAKYFFIVFLITTILPLVLMFAWNNSQMEKFHNIMMKNGLNIVYNKMDHTIKNNLKAQEGDVLRKTYFMNKQNYTLEKIKEILPEYNVQIIDNPIQNSQTPYSYYERINSNLYMVTMLPYNGRGNVKVSQKVDFVQLHPTGPFNLEITFDNGGKYKYLSVDNIEFLKKKKNDRFLKLADKVFKLSSEHKYQKTLKIKNNNNKPIAAITLSIEDKTPRGKIDNILTGLIILIVGIISSFVIGLIIKKLFVVPIMALSAASAQIKRGNFAFRLNTDTRIELIQSLYNSFNDMAQNLDTKEKLRESFISNLTHDLRTPLVSQAQSLGFISEKFKEIGLQNEYELAESLAKNNEHLLKMVNLILESYSFDSSKLKLKKEQVDLYEIIEDCHEKLRPLLSEKKIDFINNIYKDGTKIEADLFQLTRVFINLLSNAIENTNEGNYIKVGAKFEDKNVYITIEDNGNGIAPEDLKVIFDRYYSGKSLERKLGSGFGLSVCQNLISMHGGEITVESELNKFTRFTIRLPIGA